MVLVKKLVVLFFKIFDFHVQQVKLCGFESGVIVFW
jgi:hypothetical protein